MILTHFVFKKSDAQKYLSPHKMKQLYDISRAIEKGRKQDGKPINEYYICNTDEPYADKVHNVILVGERLKNEEK